MTTAAGQAPGPASDVVGSPAALPGTKPRGMFLRGLEVFLENKLAIAGVVLLVLIFGFCYLGPLIYHTDQVHVNLANENLPPGPGRPLGTDQNGYDILGRLMVAGQISLEVGLAAAILATVVGTLWGAIAGYFGGITDSVMMRVVDALLAIPTLFLALVVVAIWPPTETELILVIALTSWLTTSRLIRGEALSLRVRDYVQAMRVMGGGSARAVFRHIAPNAIGTIIVNATFQVADAILLIVALSYLGLGIRPPQTDWGGMLSQGLNAVYNGYWWQIFPAGIAIILVVIAINFIGDALRDAFEVRLQQRLSSFWGRFSVGSASLDRGPAHRDPAAPRGRPRDRRRLVDGEPRRVPRHRRRVRQWQDDDRTVDHAAAANRRVGRRRQHRAGREGPRYPLGVGHGGRARQPDRDDLPGPADLAQPDDDDRRPDRRVGPAAPGGVA
jgi:peptide/nickel transport system permease protein